MISYLLMIVGLLGAGVLAVWFALTVFFGERAHRCAAEAWSAAVMRGEDRSLVLTSLESNP